MVDFKKNSNSNFSKKGKQKNEEDFSVENYENNLGDVSPRDVMSEENFAPDQIFEEPIEIFEDAPQQQNLNKTKLSAGKIIFLSIVFVVIAAFAGLYFYVSNIDWNQHKDKIAAEFSAVTGKRIVFDGAVHLSFLPSPKLTAENIKIYTPGEHLDDPLAEIKSLSTDLTLSSLINGDFDVKIMTLNGAKIYFELLENDKLNWDTPLSQTQKNNLENTQITLDSVLLRDSQIQFINKKRKIDYTINDVNAEIIAQSLLGPYRLEGTYIKNNNPEGFAFSIGKITEGLATSVNMVINQPATETFVRFDGSLMPQNLAVNGNLIFESKKLVNFVNSNYPEINLKKDYDYPLALTLEVKSNKSKIELSNFVLKYGQTAGAGNLLIPLPKPNQTEKVKAEMSFKFAYLDLAPLKTLLSDLWQKYKDGTAIYNPNLGFDLLADFESVKTVYNGESLKDFKLSLDLLDNKLIFRTFSAVLPGDAMFNLSGEIYSELEKLNFNLKPSFDTNNLRHTLAWLKIDPKNKNDLFLRKLKFSTTMGGTMDKFALSNIALLLDKSAFAGNFALLRDKNAKMLLEFENNSFNFDDYFPEFSQNLQNKSWLEKWNMYFQSVGEFENLYAEIKFKSQNLSMDKNILENISLDAKLEKNILTLNDLNIEKFNGNQINLKGDLLGFGKKAQFKNIKYSFVSDNVSGLLDYLPIQKPEWDYSQIKTLKASGILTGYPNHFATKSILNFNNFDCTYSGQFLLKNNAWEFQRGNIEIKSPDFVKFVNALNFEYEPKDFILGAFSLSSNIEGNLNNYNLNSINANIGSNIFKGDLEYAKVADLTKIYTNLQINRFELDKFFYNTSQNNLQNNNFSSGASQNVDFLIQPIFDVSKLNFNWIKQFEIDGTFDIEMLSYKKHNFGNAKFQIISNGDVFQLKDFVSQYNDASFGTNFMINLSENLPDINGTYILNGFELSPNTLSGKKYGISQGVLNLEGSFSGIISSYDELYKSLVSSSKFNILNATVLGWNFSEILANLQERQTSDGLSEFVLKSLQNKKINIPEINGVFQTNKGEYKLENVEFKIDNVLLSMTAQGSLLNWTIDSLFGLKFVNPDYLPEISFSYSGSLSMPSLNVDVDNLGAMYNRRLAEIEKQKQLELQAKKEEMNKKLANLLLITDSVEKQIQSFIDNDLLTRENQAQSEEAIKAYAKIRNKLRELESNMAKVRLKAEAPNVTEEILAEIEQLNSDAQRNMKIISEDITRISLNNLREILNKSYDELNKLKKQYNENLKKISPKMEQFYADLNKISSRYIIDADIAYINLKKQFDEEKNMFDALAKTSEEIYMNIQNNSDETAYLQASENLKKFVLQLQENLEQMESSLNKIFDYLEKRIIIENDIYEKKKREEEIKRKLEENTGSISVKGTGVSKTVTRDIEEIEESEKNLQNQTSQPLNFEKTPEQDIKKQNIIKKSSDISPKKENKTNSLLLKKSDGKISKASGVIIKK